jgi:hypothetical protein
MTTLRTSRFLRIRTTLLTPRSCRTVLKRTGQTTQNLRNSRVKIPVGVGYPFGCGALYTCTFTDPAITVFRSMCPHDRVG